MESSGTVEIAEARTILVTLDRRSNNPILREAQLDHESPAIPWLGNRRIRYMYT